MADANIITEIKLLNYFITNFHLQKGDTCGTIKSRTTETMYVKV